MTFLLFVAVAILTIMVFSLRERVVTLEWELRERGEAREPERDATQPSPPPPPHAPQPVSDLRALSARVPEEPMLSEREDSRAAAPARPHATTLSPRPEPLFTPRPAQASPPTTARLAIPNVPRAADNDGGVIGWLKDGFLLKMGALVFFIGIALFMSYAFRNDWVGPSMRILIGMLIGLGFYGLSLWRIGMYRLQGLVFNALGTASVLTTVFAAQFVYELFNGFFAIALMVLAVSWSVVVALRHESEALAIAGALAGCAVPFLANVPEPSITGLLTYLFALTTAFLVVVRATGWTRLIVVMLIVVVGMLLMLFAGGAADTAPVAFRFFAFAFTLLFFGAGSLSLIARRAVSVHDLTIIGGNGVAALMWIHLLVPELLQGLIAYLAAAVAAGTALWCSQHVPYARLALLHAGLALLYLFVGTTYLFSGFTLTIVLMAEVALILIGAMQYRFPRATVERLSWLLLIPIATSVDILTSALWNSGVLHPAFLACVTIIGGAYFIGAVAHQGRYERMHYTALVLATGYVPLTAIKVVGALDAGAHEAYLASGLALFALSAACIVHNLGWSAPAVKLQAVHLFLPVLLTGALITDPLWDSGWLHGAMLALVVVFVAATGLALLFHTRGDAVSTQLCAVAAGWVALVLPWLTCFSVLSSENAFAVLTIVYTLYATSGIVLVLEKVVGGGGRWWTAISVTLALWCSLFVVTADAWREGIAHWPFLGLFAITVAAIGVCVLIFLEDEAGEYQSWVRAAAALAASYLALFIWLVTHALFAAADVATFVALVLYGAIGIALYLSGQLYGLRLARIIGAVFILGVVGRLLIIEVWSMELSWRILTFAGVGILLLGSSFIESALGRAREQD